MKPSVGRIVHYVSYGTPGGEYASECRAAIVTAASGVYVNLAVLNPEGMFFKQELLQDEEGHKGGSWHWPERVD